MAVGTSSSLFRRTLNSSFATQLMPWVPSGCKSPSAGAGLPLMSNVRFMARMMVVFEAAASGCCSKGAANPRSASTTLPTKAPAKVVKNYFNSISCKASRANGRRRVFPITSG